MRVSAEERNERDGMYRRSRSHKYECSESARERRIALYKSDQ